MAARQNATLSLVLLAAGAGWWLHADKTANDLHQWLAPLRVSARIEDTDPKRSENDLWHIAQTRLRAVHRRGQFQTELLQGALPQRQRLDP